MRGLIMLCCFAILLFGCSHTSVGPSPNAPANTAMYKLAYVNSLAGSYGKGLQLVIVENGTGGVNTDGTSEEWLYAYVATSTPHATYWFHANEGGVAYDSTGAALPGMGIINQTWFNSDSALAVAEKNGGSQFRTQNPHCIIMAALGEAVVPNPKAFWYVSYYSTDNKTVFVQINVDASSGEVFVL
ncbi:MAG TPA: hypothetical protein VLX91_15500 [Candidatus Acidoferrales bacterium]|nr:hypothetical protein [Candidatus Acidoferrales bacterium]